MPDRPNSFRMSRPVPIAGSMVACALLSAANLYHRFCAINTSVERQFYNASSDFTAATWITVSRFQMLKVRVWTYREGGVNEIQLNDRDGPDRSLLARLLIHDDIACPLLASL